MDREYFDNLKANGYKYQKTVKLPKKASVKVWKLIHTMSKETIISGDYSLCKWKLKSFHASVQKCLKIIPN
jgi:hypothetical protein